MPRPAVDCRADFASEACRAPTEITSLKAHRVSCPFVRFYQPSAMQNIRQFSVRGDYIKEIACMVLML